MAMLALNGTTIPLAFEPIEAEVEDFADRAPAHDGTMNTRARATKQNWQCVTRWLTEAEAATILAVLQAAAPHTATGDLTGSISVIIQLTNRITHSFADGRRRRFEFSMREE